MKFVRFPAPTLCAALLLAASPVFGASISAGDVVTVSNQQGSVFTPSPVPADTNGLYRDLTIRLNGTTNIAVRAGMFVLDYRIGASAWEQFETFCLQPDVYLQPFSNPYQAVELGGSAYAPDAGGISELYGRFREAVVDNRTAAAFQVALWELAYDSGGDLSLGRFQLANLGSDVALTARAWLNALDGTGPRANLLALVSNPQLADRQDLLVHDVPEPGVLALLGTGLFGLAFRRRAPRAA